MKKPIKKKAKPAVCTKPNCDCVEKEMERMGQKGIKSYPCLKSDSEDDFKQKKS